MAVSDISINNNRSYSIGMVGLGVLMALFASSLVILPDSATTSQQSQTSNIYIQFLLENAGYWPMALVSFAVGGLLILYNLQPLFCVDPLLSISEKGLIYHRFGPNAVAWETIEAVGLDEAILGLPGTARVRLVMDGPVAIIDQQAALHRRLRGITGPFDKTNFIIHVAELDITASELETIIRRRLHR